MTTPADLQRRYIIVGGSEGDGKTHKGIATGFNPLMGF